MKAKKKVAKQVARRQARPAAKQARPATQAKSVARRAAAAEGTMLASPGMVPMPGPRARGLPQTASTAGLGRPAFATNLVPPAAAPRAPSVTMLEAASAPPTPGDPSITLLRHAAVDVSELRATGTPGSRTKAKTRTTKAPTQR